MAIAPLTLLEKAVNEQRKTFGDAWQTAPKGTWLAWYLQAVYDRLEPSDKDEGKATDVRLRVVFS